MVQYCYESRWRGSLVHRSDCIKIDASSLASQSNTLLCKFYYSQMCSISRWGSEGSGGDTTQKVETLRDLLIGSIHVCHNPTHSQCASFPSSEQIWSGTDLVTHRLLGPSPCPGGSVLQGDKPCQPHCICS